MSATTDKGRHLLTHDEKVKVHGTPDKHRMLRVIAIYKAFKTCALLLVAAFTFHLLKPDFLGRVTDRLGHLPLAAGHHIAVHAAALISGLSPRSIYLIGGAALVYALVFAIEGIGLWLRKRWGEYFTIIATSSLIPLELWEVVRHFTLLKLAALLANVAIVAYLVVILRRDAAKE
jgi:uncharacterized membrane protein (DUF2068 family)